MPKAVKKPGVTAVVKSWTVAVFMVGERDLANAMKIDFLELAKVGSSAEVNVVVAQQAVADGVTKWFEIPEGRPEQPSQRKEVGPGSDRGVALAQRLDGFLQFVLKEYPAEQYLVILWGHGSGLSFGNLAPRASRDRASLRELSNALRNFRKHRPGGEQLEVLGFSSCALSKAEFALELRDVVRYLVASQIGINSLMTWPFDDILHGLVISPGVSPQALVGQIVRSFQDFYEPPPVALTALDLGQSRHLKGLVDGVANAVHKILKEFDAGALTKAEREGLHDPVKWLENANKLSPETQVAFFGSLSVYQAFLEALDAFPFEHEDLVDFFDFCLKLVGLNPELGSENLKRAREVAQGILNAGTQPFVAHNVRVGPKLQALNGLSVIAPDFKNENWVTEWEAQRQKEKDEGGECWLWDQTTWPDMVVALFQFSRALPPSIVEQSVD